jgi:phage I-like protein
MSKRDHIFQGRGATIEVGEGTPGLDALPATIQIMPISTVEATWDYENRTFKLSDPAAVISASITRAKDGILLLDFNHGTQRFAGDARAAGWLSNLRVETGHIVADVEWTAAGRASVAAREYRFLSPTFTANDKSNEITTILSVGLVNYPAIHDLAKVASATTETPKMDPTLQAIRDALELGADATEEQILAGVQSTITASAAGTAAIAALELEESATGDDITAAITTISASAGSGNPDPKRFVPIEGLTEALERVQALEIAHSASAAETAVADAMAAGKVTPALKNWATDYAVSDLAGFQAYVASATAIGKGGKPVAGDPPTADEAELSASDRAVIAASAGQLTEAAYLKTKKAKLAAAKGAN